MEAENTNNTERKNTIVRTISFDGMGGKESEYQCCKCKSLVDRADKFCSNCGERFDQIYHLDTWGRI